MISLYSSSFILKGIESLLGRKLEEDEIEVSSSKELKVDKINPSTMSLVKTVSSSKELKASYPHRKVWRLGKFHPQRN